MATVTLKSAARKLNQLLVQDPEAVSHLAELHVDCNPLKIKNPKFIVCRSYWDRPLMGLLEVMNALFDGSEIIRAVKENDRVVKFICVPRVSAEKAGLDKKCQLE